MNQAEFERQGGAALDALFLPFGTEALLIPMVILNSQNAFRYATVAACGAVAGSSPSPAKRPVSKVGMRKAW